MRKTTERTAIIFGLLALISAGCASMDKTTVHGLLGRYGVGTSRPAKVCIDMTIEAAMGDARQHDVCKMWFDVEQGRYLLVRDSTQEERGRTQQVKSGLLGSAAGEVFWAWRNGRLSTVRRLDSPLFTIGAFPIYQDLGPFVVLFDAFAGYPSLRRGPKLMGGAPAGVKPDDLDWFLVQKPVYGEDSPFGQAVSGGKQGSVWLGFDPKTGWVRGIVFHGYTRRAESAVISITRADTKPDLAGVFELPAEVKAKLKEKNK